MRLIPQELTSEQPAPDIHRQGTTQFPALFSPCLHQKPYNERVPDPGGGGDMPTFFFPPLSLLPADFGAQGRLSQILVCLSQREGKVPHLKCGA